MMSTTDPIVRTIRAEMIRRGVNGDEMAARTFISTSTFYKRLERPETFKLDELRLIAKFLKIDIGDLVRGKA